MTQRTLCLLALGAMLLSEVGAQQYVYPSKGQTPQQQKGDEAACHSWAVQQSGFDPAKPSTPPPAAKPPTTATGTTPGAGARGAVRGAVVGEVVGGDAGAGAAAGAVAARGQSRRQNAAAARSAEQQHASAAQQQQAGFARARAACLEGRGYTIR
ncbi:glycine zipper family protein [Variovorax sp. DT-64]|uniref:glycine zipper family protein n=1 Tax=Variovorax sp. DT-64 TaxID=3396160 RepID=UPI003F54263F